MTTSDRETDARAPDAAWIAFCEALKEAGAILRRPAIADDTLSLAEGHRHLVRMIRAGFEVVSEFGDPLHPEFFPMASRTVLAEGVTSDARYMQAFIDGSARHVIRGKRGTAPLIEFGVYTGRTGFHPTSDLQHCITEAELVVSDDGSFTIDLGPEKGDAPNWIRTDSETRYVFIRQYAHDWSETVSGSFELDRLDSTGPRAPITLDHVQEALERTARFVQSAPALWTGISDYWAENAVNEIVAQEEASSDTDITVPSGHRFACGYFELEADEALVVRFDPPTDAPYWGIHLDNYFYEPLSWNDNRSQLNNRTATRDADGRVTIVISDRAPAGAPNWLETQGHRQGSAVFRWSRSHSPCPVFSCRVAPVARWDEEGEA